MKKTIIIILLTLVNGSINGQNSMLGNDINLYKGTEAWTLAMAIHNNDTVKVKRLCMQNSKLLNFQEPRFGKTLLQWAVYTNKFSSSKALVEMGADPNKQSFNGTSAFIDACNKDKTSDYAKLLLKYGGDVNAIAKPDSSKAGFIQQLKTPLIAASKSNLETVKLLVEAGANLNYIGEQWQSALRSASNFDQIEILNYLIIEKNANFKNVLGLRSNGDSIYITNMLRQLRFELDSKKYELKMELVEYLKKNGMNYWETKIPPHLYDVHPKEYLDKY
jgi:ankyrin repeat protein